MDEDGKSLDRAGGVDVHALSELANQQVLSVKAGDPTAR
jgi:hypothetical protein